MKRLLMALTLVSAPIFAQQAPILDNRASDPRQLGWMQGSPVPAEKAIRYQDGSYWTFPKLRWAFSNMQQVMPTQTIRHNGPTRAIPYALRTDIDDLMFLPIGSKEIMTWRQSLDANYTDVIVVMHKGRIVYEYVFGAYDMSKTHVAASVTKSFVGLIATALIHEGKLDPNASVERYLPEMAGSGFAGATVQQLLDMTTAVDYNENYVTPGPEARMYFAGSGWLHPAGYDGPKTNFDALRAFARKGEHGAGFAYRSPQTDVLGYIIERVEKKPFTLQMEQRFWSKLGMESDANIYTDSVGSPFFAGVLSLQLRDLARFAEMLRNNGRVGKAQVIPAAVVTEIRKGGDRAKFGTDYPTLPGWSYHNQLWISHDDHGMYMGRGVHGQMFYVNPKAELVIARFGSHPTARNMAIDPNSRPAWRALAEHLIRKPKG